MAGKKELKQDAPKNSKVGLQATSIEIILSDGTKLVSKDAIHASDIYRWWCQCEEFAGLHGHRYPSDKHPLQVIEPDGDSK